MFSIRATPQRPGQRFWRNHLWIPLLVLGGILLLLETTGIDHALAGFYYRMQGGDWILRHNWFTYGVMHRGGKRLVIAIGLVILALFIASFLIRKLRYWRWPLAFTSIAIVVLPALIAELKKFSGVPCPWDVTDFGGTQAWLHNFQYVFGEHVGHCFPAGHASGGYGLLALYVAFWPWLRKGRGLLLIPGVVVGTAFGTAQQVRGAHFISHDFWTISIVWFGLLFLFWLGWKFFPPAGSAVNASIASAGRDAPAGRPGG